MSFKTHVFILLGLLGFQLLEGATTTRVFAKYPNKYFIETGSYLGSGIGMALEAGFEQVYSIELSPDLYQGCCERFASHPKVFLYEGDSSKVLSFVLQRIDAPATFWLDGHYSGAGTAKGDTCSPILNELEEIRQHFIKTHTILIDDVRLFGAAEFDYVTLDEVIAKIYEINSRYKISFENGHFADDVLVARIPPD